MESISNKLQTYIINTCCLHSLDTDIEDWVSGLNNKNKEEGTLAGWLVSNQPTNRECVVQQIGIRRNWRCTGVEWTGLDWTYTEKRVLGHQASDQAVEWNSKGKRRVGLVSQGDMEEMM
ncbi:unnamed protein product [Heterobilharzia americana]|nr:unnamed protein product [Heterobilharzia americana]